MTLQHYKYLSIGLGACLIVVVCFTIPFLLRSSAPPVSPAQLAEAPDTEPVPAPAPVPTDLPLPATPNSLPKPAATTSRPRPPIAPATPAAPPLIPGGHPGDALAWTNVENDLTLTRDAGIFHIVGTVGTARNLSHLTGFKSEKPFDDGDFILGVDFKSPSFSTAASCTIDLRAVGGDGSDNGMFTAIDYAPGGCHLQAGRPDHGGPVLRAAGNEQTTFHRLTLQFNATSQVLAGWVDGKATATMYASFSGKRQFLLSVFGGRPGTPIDVTFQNFVMLNGAEATTALRQVPLPTGSPPPAPVASSVPPAVALQQWNASRARELAAALKPARTLMGHTDGIASLAFSPDGNTLASGSGDRTIRLWDVAKGTTTRILQGHRNAVTSLEFSADGKRLLSSGADGRLIVWNVDSGVISATFDQFFDMSIAHWLPGEKQVVAANGTAVRIWNLADGSNRFIKLESDSVTAIAVTPKGQVIVGSYDGFIQLLDPASGRVLKSHQRDNAPTSRTPNRISTIQILKNGQVLFGDTQALWSWDLDQDRITLLAQGYELNLFVALPDQERIVVQSAIPPYFTDMKFSTPISLDHSGWYSLLALAVSSTGSIAECYGGGVNLSRWQKSDTPEAIYVYDRDALEKARTIAARQPPSDLAPQPGPPKTFSTTEILSPWR